MRRTIGLTGYIDIGTLTLMPTIVRSLSPIGGFGDVFTGPAYLFQSDTKWVFIRRCH